MVLAWLHFVRAVRFSPSQMCKSAAMAQGHSVVVISMAHEVRESFYFGEDDDEETLPCSWTYVIVCIFLSFLNGQLHALIFPSYTLHYDEMGWRIVRAGLTVSVGFALSVLVQHVVLRSGCWLIVPLAMVHLAFAILPLISSSSVPFSLRTPPLPFIFGRRTTGAKSFGKEGIAQMLGDFIAAVNQMIPIALYLSPTTSVSHWLPGSFSTLG